MPRYSCASVFGPIMAKGVLQSVDRDVLDALGERRLPSVSAYNDIDTYSIFITS